MVATLSGISSARARAAITALAQSMGGLAGHQGGIFVAVVNSDDQQAVRDALKKIVQEEAGEAVVGLAGPAAGLHALPDLFADARRCTAVLRALGRTGELATPEDLSFYRFLFAEASNANLTVFVEKTIGDLMSYDEEHSTDFVRTLSAFLDCGRHHAETSRRLNIHHNTLHQRLRRIDDIIGNEWRDPVRSLEMHIALHVHQLMSSPAGGRSRPT
jgi:DNA-binding PucR family transcriptional regulator